MSSLAERLRTGEHLSGAILKMSSPGFVELCGHLGFDLVVIDAEHGAGDTLVLEHHLRAAASAGVPVLVRIPANDPVWIQSVLDAGAAGVIVPHVGTPEQATAAVAAAHYPPFGSRGLAMTTRAGHQGTGRLEDHLRTAHEQTVVVVQLEDRSAADNVAAIAATPGVDAAWIGPNDLALALGHLRPDEPEVQAVINGIAAAVVASPAALVALCNDRADAARWRDLGATVSLFTAHRMFIEGARAALPAPEDGRAIGQRSGAGPVDSRRT